MEIQIKTDEKGGAFYIEQDNAVVAEMTFVNAGPGKVIIDHTEVSPILGGQGVGAKLVAAGVEYARKNNLKIMPLCPFAKKVFDKTPEYEDVRF